MELIHTEIDIEASPESAWRVLTDFGSYPEWNPFIRKIEGRPAQGERLEVELHVLDGAPRRFRPTITHFVEGEEVRWLGRLWVPGLLDGEHAFKLERFRPDRVRFFQREIFRGVLTPVVARRHDRIGDAFTRMNQAFKARVEAQR